MRLVACFFCIVASYEFCLHTQGTGESTSQVHLLLVFLLTGFGGLLTDFGGLSALDIANTRARLKSGLLLAEFVPFRFLEGLQNLASSVFIFTDFEFFLGVRAWTLGFRRRS